MGTTAHLVRLLDNSYEGVRDHGQKWSALAMNQELAETLRILTAQYSALAKNIVEIADPLGELTFNSRPYTPRTWFVLDDYDQPQ